HLRMEGVYGIHLTHDLPITDMGNQSGTDSLSVAFRASQRDLQVMALGEVVLIEPKYSAAGVARHHVHPAVVPEIRRDDATAVAVVVRRGKVADVQEVAALHVPKDALAFIST